MLPLDRVVLIEVCQTDGASWIGILLYMELTRARL